MEKLTNKEKIGVTTAASMLVSITVISWGCPEILFGWSIPSICGLWLGMSAVMMAAIWSAVLAVRIISGLHRAAIEREIREQIQLYGRDWRYIRVGGHRGAK